MTGFPPLRDNQPLAAVFWRLSGMASSSINLKNAVEGCKSFDTPKRRATQDERLSLNWRPHRSC
jgi:hypothetical protein